MTAEAKYLKVARILQKRIEDGVYKTQAPLPDQKTLADELQVSRLTVKKALDGLQRKGLVYKESGLGREWGDYGIEEFLEVKSIAGYFK